MSDTNSDDLLSPRAAFALRVLTVVLLAIGLALGVYFWYQNTSTLKSSDARIQGALYSQTARSSGQILEVLVKDGDVVEKGTPLLTLHFPELDKQKEDASTALVAARALYAQVSQGRRGQPLQTGGSIDSGAVARLEQAAQHYQKMQELYALGGISAAARDRAASAYEQARQEASAAPTMITTPNQPPDPNEVRMAQQQIQQAEQKLAALQALEQQKIVTAPTSGTISLLSVRAGDNVAIGQPLLAVISNTELWLTVRVDTSDAPRLQTGQSVNFVLRDLPGQTFTGEVLETSAAGATGQRQPIKVSLPNETPSPFKSGMLADAEFIF